MNPSKRILKPMLGYRKVVAVSLLVEGMGLAVIHAECRRFDLSVTHWNRWNKRWSSNRC